MENTNCGSNCPFVKSGMFSDDKSCPNYIESWWLEKEKEKPTLIKDCSPKRSLLNDEALFNRFETSIASINQLENRIKNLEEVLMKILYQCNNLESKDKLIER